MEYFHFTVRIFPEAGENDTMRQQLAQLGGGAHALAIQILGNADDAADAVQDAFETVLAKPGSYDKRKGPLRPWFLRVVRNRCIDMLRRRRGSDLPVEQLPDTSEAPYEAVEVAETARDIQVALRSITKGQREIVVLRDYLDLSLCGDRGCT